MGIRNTAKALIVKDERILLNRCRHTDGRIYYDLPGGGQKPFETMEEAVVREVREETGYAARVLRFAGLCEEIYTDEALRAQHSDYAHRVLHIFHVALTNGPRTAPVEYDWGMEASEWIPFDALSALPEIRPHLLRESLPALIHSPFPLFLGTEYNHTATP